MAVQGWKGAVDHLSGVAQQQLGSACRLYRCWSSFCRRAAQLNKHVGTSWREEQGVRRGKMQGGGGGTGGTKGTPAIFISFCDKRTVFQ